MSKITSRALAPSTTFVSGAEHANRIGHYINCANNPYDLRPVVDIIVNAAYTMRKTLPDDQPVAIIMGESHHISSQVALIQMITGRLNGDKHKATVNFEWDHNCWSRYTEKLMGKDVPSELYYTSHEYDPIGQAALSTFLGYEGFGGAPVSFENLMAFCYAEKIPFTFNETARNNAGDLDMVDPFTAAITGQYLDKTDLSKLALNRSNQESIPTCMAIANLAMAHRGVEFAKIHGSQFIVQQVGLNHIFGTALDDCPHDESLTITYRNAGAAVLPVFTTNANSDFGLNILPEAAHEELRNSVIIEGTSEGSFLYGQEDQEHVEINKLNAHSDAGIEIYDVAGQKEHYKTLAQQDADEVIARYKKAQANLAPRF